MNAHAVALAANHGQEWRQVAELLVAFGLSCLIGMERQLKGKHAGLRTQAIVGTTAALMLLISKYGFGDVLASGRVVLDPSRVAAQIVSGIGFLGAGLIITRQGAIRGLTTAASVWETAGIGMAAGAGLPLLALLVTGLHFVIVLGFTPLVRRLPGGRGWTTRLLVTYHDGQGVLRRLLADCSRHQWTVTALETGQRPRSDGLRDLVDAERPGQDGLVSVALTLAGRGVQQAVGSLAAIEGVATVDRLEEESE